MYSGWKPWKASILAGGLAAAFGGIEALLILTLRVRQFFATKFSVKLKSYRDRTIEEFPGP